MDSNTQHSVHVSFGLFSNKERYSLYSNIRQLSGTMQGDMWEEY